LRSSPPRSTLLSHGNAKEDDQWPGTPRPSLRSASASRSTGICRPNSDSDPVGSVTRRLAFGIVAGRHAVWHEWATHACAPRSRLRSSEVACIGRGSHRGNAQVVERAELPAWLLPDERYRRSSSRIARLRLGAASEIIHIRSNVPVYRAVTLPNRCACQRRWLSINVEMKK
jgi:hypothetical protein